MTPHMSNMQQFDFNAPAEVFAHAGRGTRRFPMTYRKFTTGAEAVRHAMEGMSADTLKGAVLESDDARFDAAGIEALYRSSDYPLQRSDSR